MNLLTQSKILIRSSMSIIKSPGVSAIMKGRLVTQKRLIESPASSIIGW